VIYIFAVETKQVRPLNSHGVCCADPKVGT
jgi:hypothetical protein